MIDFNKKSKKEMIPEHLRNFKLSPDNTLQGKYLNIDELRLMLNDAQLGEKDKNDILEYIIFMKDKAAPLVHDLIIFIEQNQNFNRLSLAIDALGEIGPAAEESILVLGTMLDNYEQYSLHDYIHINIVLALKKIGSVEVVPYLIRALRSSPSSQGPCLAVIFALTDLRGIAKEAIPTLKKISRKKSYKEYRPVIKDALKAIRASS